VFLQCFSFTRFNGVYQVYQFINTRFITRFTSLPGVITVASSESPLSFNTHPNAATHSETHTMNQPHMKADEPHTHKSFLVVLLFLPPLIMVVEPSRFSISQALRPGIQIFQIWRFRNYQRFKQRFKKNWLVIKEER
jgi:hypothetical protein